MSETKALIPEGSAGTEHDIRMPVAPKIGQEIVAREAGRGERFTPATMAQAIQFAKLMARSGTAVPAMFRGNEGLCLAVTSDAVMLGVTPYQLAREAYEVSGALAYSAKIHVAALHRSGFLRGRLKVEYRGEIKGTHKVSGKKGERDAPAGDLVCIVTGKLVDDDEPRVWESPPLGAITTKNSPEWYANPKKQLYYHTARDWQRIWCPEAMLGVMSQDDIEESEIETLKEAAARPTLIERVQAARAAEDAARAESADVLANNPNPATDADFAEVEEPAGAAAPKTADPAPETTEAVEIVEEEHGAEQAPADAAETVEEALRRLRVICNGSPNFTRLDEGWKDWRSSIADFTREEQFDLIKVGEEILGGRRVVIRREVAAAKEKAKAGTAI